MSTSHGPMSPIAFQDFIGWLHMRLNHCNPDPAILTKHTPQGVISEIGNPLVWTEDKSRLMLLTLQTVRPGRLHAEDREGDNGASRARSRFFEPEAIVVIALALANGGTMFVDDDAHDKDPSGEGRWHYPEIYAEGININRVFMDAAPGDRVRHYVGPRSHFGHRDCRKRWLYVEQGGSPRATRGVSDFLEVAERTFAKPNPVDGLTGPERFGLTTKEYVQFLVDALAAHANFNPPASPENVAEWLKEKRAA